MIMNKIRNRVYAGITLILCLLLFFEGLTGEGFHVVLGMLLFIVTLVHTYRHIHSLKYKKKSVQMVDIMMLIAMAVVCVSGIMLHPLKEMLIIIIIHKVSSVCFVVGVIAHVFHHSKQM